MRSVDPGIEHRDDGRDAVVDAVDIGDGVLVGPCAPNPGWQRLGLDDRVGGRQDVEVGSVRDEHGDVLMDRDDAGVPRQGSEPPGGDRSGEPVEGVRVGPGQAYGVVRGDSLG